VQAMTEVIWQPGTQVSIVGPRLRVRSLSETDLGIDVDDWTGSKDRTTHVWKPNMSAQEYMRGLIRHCDNSETFIFGIWSFSENGLIGYRKVQIVEEDHGRGPERTAIPTSVVGDQFAGKSYGQEAGHQANWFFIRHAGVTAISPRIYEANEKTWRLAERLGFRLSRVSEEQAPGRTPQAVRHYVLNAEELKQMFGEFYQQLRLEEPGPGPAGRSAK
jgi:RimJ/RimL family protein N-acetyltransferase